MDHDEATRMGATEKYLLGTLDESERDAFEEHYFGCIECADDVRAAAAVVAGASSLPATKTSPKKSRRPFWENRGFVGALGAVAAVAIGLVGYQRIVVIPPLERAVHEGESMRAISSHFLTLSRSEAPRVSVGLNDRHVALTLSRSWDRPFPYYRCALQDGAGRVLLAETLSSRSAADELEILLPIRELPGGSYMLVVEGVDDPAAGPRTSAPIAKYSFNLERR